MKEQQSFIGFIIDGIRGLLDLDRGLPGTFKQMFIAPSVVVNSYWNKKNAYFPPVRYIIIAGIVYALASELFFPEALLKEFIQSISTGVEAARPDIKVNPDVAAGMFVGYNRLIGYITIASLPLFAFFTYLMFWKEKVSYLKHLIMNAYISGQIVFLYAIPFLFVSWPKLFANMQMVIATIYLAYYIWATLNCFQRKSVGFKCLYIIANVVFTLMVLLLTMFLMGFYIGYYSNVS